MQTTDKEEFGRLGVELEREVPGSKEYRTRSWPGRTSRLKVKLQGGEGPGGADRDAAGAPALGT